MMARSVCMFGFSRWLCDSEALDVSCTGVGVCEKGFEFPGWLMRVVMSNSTDSQLDGALDVVTSSICNFLKIGKNCEIRGVWCRSKVAVVSCCKTSSLCSQWSPGSINAMRLYQPRQALERAAGPGLCRRSFGKDLVREWGSLRFPILHVE